MDTVKESLHRRKLIAGPNELKKIPSILEGIAIKRNNKWSLKKESSLIGFSKKFLLDGKRKKNMYKTQIFKMTAYYFAHKILVSY